MKNELTRASSSEAEAGSRLRKPVKSKIWSPLRFCRNGLQSPLSRRRSDKIWTSCLGSLPPEQAGDAAHRYLWPIDMGRSFCPNYRSLWGRRVRVAAVVWPAIQGRAALGPRTGVVERYNPSSQMFVFRARFSDPARPGIGAGQQGRCLHSVQELKI